MAQTGGSVESITLQGRTFAVAADADANVKLGGFTNEVAANGDGSARQLKTREPWSISDLAVAIDPDNGDHEFLQDISDAQVFAPVTITYASGAVYQGSGQITGDLQVSTANTTAGLSLMGTGTLTKQ
jgi:hypothetical protein